MREIIFLNEDAAQRQVLRLEKQLQSAATPEQKEKIQAQIDRVKAVNGTGERMEAAKANAVNPTDTEAVKHRSLKARQLKTYAKPVDRETYDPNSASRHTDRKAQDAAKDETYTRNLHRNAAFKHNMAMDYAAEAGRPTATVTNSTKGGKTKITRTISATGRRALYPDYRERSLGDTNWKGKVTSH